MYCSSSGSGSCDSSTTKPPRRWATKKFICWAYDQNSGELRIHTDEEMDHPSFTSRVYCQKITHPGWENYSTEDLKVNARNVLKNAKPIDAKNSNNFTAPIKRSGLDLQELWCIISMSIFFWAILIQESTYILLPYKIIWVFHDIFWV